MPLLLIDPVMLSLLVFKNLSLLEPQSNLFLRALDSIGAVADIAADILRKQLAALRQHMGQEWRTIAKSPRMVPGDEFNGFVAPRRAICLSVTVSFNGEEPRRAGAEHTTSGLDGITSLPDHGADGTAQHV